jgi:hypothetical protein
VHQIEGHRNFILGPQDTWKKYRESYFCPVLQGDLPYQKRFFDVVLSGCIPVVLSFESKDNNPHKSWFGAGSLGYNYTYPFAYSEFMHSKEEKERLGLVDYNDFVVQVNTIDEIVPTIESLLNDKTRIQNMQTALGKAAQKFAWGLGDEMLARGDAFDHILLRLEEYVHL